MFIFSENSSPCPKGSEKFLNLQISSKYQRAQPNLKSSAVSDSKKILKLQILVNSSPVTMMSLLERLVENAWMMTGNVQMLKG